MFVFSCSSSLDTTRWGCTVSPIWRMLLLLRSSKKADVHPSPIPNHRRASLNICKPLVNRLRPLPYPLPALWPFARTLGGIATPLRNWRYSWFGHCYWRHRQARIHFSRWFEGNAEKGEINYGPCSEDANPSLFPFPFPPWSCECDIARQAITWSTTPASQPLWTNQDISI